MAAREEDFVTQLQLYKHTDLLKKELKQEISGVKLEVKEVAKSVDILEETVLPIAGILKLIEHNTRETSDAIKELSKDQKELTKEQKNLTGRLYAHDIAINDLQRDDDVKLENTKGKWGVIGTVTTFLLGGSGILLAYGTQIAEFFFGK